MDANPVTKTDVQVDSYTPGATSGASVFGAPPIPPRNNQLPALPALPALNPGIYHSSDATKLFSPTPESERLFREMESRGITLRSDGQKLWATPRSLLRDEDMRTLVNNKADFLAIATRITCEKCGRRFDKRGICWNCPDRRCPLCGRMTGSCFIVLCLFCGAADTTPRVPGENP